MSEGFESFDSGDWEKFQSNIDRSQTGPDQWEQFEELQDNEVYGQEKEIINMANQAAENLKNSAREARSARSSMNTPPPEQTEQKGMVPSLGNLPAVTDSGTGGKKNFYWGLGLGLLGGIIISKIIRK